MREHQFVEFFADGQLITENKHMYQYVSELKNTIDNRGEKADRIAIVESELIESSVDDFLANILTAYKIIIYLPQNIIYNCQKMLSIDELQTDKNIDASIIDKKAQNTNLTPNFILNNNILCITVFNKNEAIALLKKARKLGFKFDISIVK